MADRGGRSTAVSRGADRLRDEQRRAGMRGRFRVRDDASDDAQPIEDERHPTRAPGSVGGAERVDRCAGGPVREQREREALDRGKPTMLKPGVRADARDAGTGSGELAERELELPQLGPSAVCERLWEERQDAGRAREVVVGHDLAIDPAQLEGGDPTPDGDGVGTSQRRCLVPVARYRTSGARREARPGPGSASGCHAAAGRGDRGWRRGARYQLPAPCRGTPT